MKAWQEDLLCAFDKDLCEHGLFQKIETAARVLGFEYCAYGLRAPLPLSNPKTIMLNNYPSGWQLRYQQQNYLSADPTVLHGRRSRVPILWSDEVFAGTPELWDEAQSCGLRHGWAQSSLDASGVVGMLTLARSSEPLTEAELRSIETRMRWLVQISHMAMSRALDGRLGLHPKESLTEREIEVLQWTADGKTTAEVSEILSISDHTVNFHVKNAISKLGVANKTAAVVQAAVLGMLHA